MTAVSFQYPDDDNELVELCDTIMNWDKLLPNLINGDNTKDAIDVYFKLYTQTEPNSNTKTTEIQVDANIVDILSRYDGINVNIIYSMTQNRMLCIDIANLRRPPQFESESMYIASMYISIGNEMKRCGILHTWFNITMLNKIIHGMGIFREFMSKGALQYRVKRGLPIFDTYVYSKHKLKNYIYRFSADCLNFFNNYHSIPVYHLSNPNVVSRLVDKSSYVTNVENIQLATVDPIIDYAKILNSIGCTKRNRKFGL